MRQVRKKLHYTSREVARILGVSDKVVRAQAARGELPASKTAPGKGHWRFASEEIDRLVAEIPAPVPAQPSAAEIAQEIVSQLLAGGLELALVVRPPLTRP